MAICCPVVCGHLLSRDRRVSVPQLPGADGYRSPGAPEQRGRTLGKADEEEKVSIKMCVLLT